MSLMHNHFVFCNQSSHITEVSISEGSLWLNTMINSVCMYAMSDVACAP